MFIAYLRTFAAMGMHAIPMRADTGPIGGDLSHEFHIVAATGESGVFYHERWEQPRSLDVDADDAAALQAYVDGLNADYAATDEKRDPAAEAATGASLKEARGIEVGQIFYFGTKYSAAMGLSVQGPGGEQIVPHMGSYGIGVSRLMAAIIEASHDKDGIIWPEAVAPYRVALINLRADDAGCTAAADALYATLEAAGVEVLYDDRDERGGAKFATADLIGIPWQVVIGPKGVAAATVEVKRRGASAKDEMSVDAAVAKLCS
jgi:prolyl-tRNA synthetase